MNGLDYAKVIIDLVENRKIENISQMIEKFELECCIRQYANIKAMNLPVSGYISKSYSEIKEDLKLFKDAINQYVDCNKYFNYGPKSTVALIGNGIVPHRIEDSYNWLEQMRYFFMDCEYEGDVSDVSCIEEYINKNTLLKKYMNHHHLKGLKIFYPEVYCQSRMASSFYYDNAIAVYNWRYTTDNIISSLRGTISQIGSMYYIPTILNGDKDNLIKLRELVSRISQITDNTEIINMPEMEIFADFFSLYIMNYDTKTFNLENIGVMFYLIEGNEVEVLNEISTYFSNIIENNNKICRPTIPNPLNRML